MKQYTPEELAQRTIERRAVEAVIWGMPAVNFELMFQAMVNGQGATSTRSSTGRGLSTGRTRRSRRTPTRSTSCPSSTPRTSGPMVLEIPPADDGLDHRQRRRRWQAALEDVGPAGVDKGKGGKYLILPPGYKDKVPDGYIALPSEHLHRLRAAALQPQERQRRRHRQGRRLRQAGQVLSALAGGQPAGDDFVDAIDVVFDSTIPYDLRFFEALDRFVQREPWLERDKAMIDQLKSIGIEKGKPFNPDAKTQEDPRGDAQRGAGLARRSSTRRSSRRRSTKAATGRCRPRRRSPKAMQTQLRQARRLSRRRPRRHAIRWPISAPSTWARASST